MGSISVFSLLILTSLVGTAFRVVDWKTLESGQGGFSIAMPGTVREDSTVITTTSGPLNYHQFSTQSDSVGYLVTYADFYEEALKVTGIEETLKDAVNGVVASSKGAVTAENDLTLGKYPGKEVKIEVPPMDRAPEGGSIWLRLYLVDNRLYQLAVFARRNSAFGESPAKFLKSFKLLKR